MPLFLLLVFRFFQLLLSGHQAVTIENMALGMQIAAFQRKKKRPLLTTFDRVFWITLRSLWSDWRRPLMYVQPATVVRWQCERFRRLWARRVEAVLPWSRSSRYGHRTPPINRTNRRGQTVGKCQDSVLGRMGQLVFVVRPL
jgi:hypothetical protein